MKTSNAPALRRFFRPARSSLRRPRPYFRSSTSAWDTDRKRLSDLPRLRGGFGSCKSRLSARGFRSTPASGRACPRACVHTASRGRPRWRALLPLGESRHCKAPDTRVAECRTGTCLADACWPPGKRRLACETDARRRFPRSEEHTSELQSRLHLVCRLLLEKKKSKSRPNFYFKCLRNNKII